MKANKEVKCIGVVFDIDALGGGCYGIKAMRIFMQNLPSGLRDYTIKAGDTDETLECQRREYCIALGGIGLDINAVKVAFSKAKEKGLAALNRRFITSPELEKEPLCYEGKISNGKIINIWEGSTLESYLSAGKERM